MMYQYYCEGINTLLEMARLFKSLSLPILKGSISENSETEQDLRNEEPSLDIQVK